MVAGRRNYSHVSERCREVTPAYDHAWVKKKEREKEGICNQVVSPRILLGMGGISHGNSHFVLQYGDFGASEVRIPEPDAPSVLA